MKEQIDLPTFNKLIMNNAIAPKIYGLIKTYKVEYPIRTIMLSTGGPSYNISKGLVPCINNYLKNYNIWCTNSSEVLERITDIKLPNNYILFSLDVVSLFTNFPLELVLNAINKYWNNLKNYTDFDLHTFIQLISFCYNTSYFSYKDIIYKQEFNARIGGALSPPTTNLAMTLGLDSVIPLLDFELPYNYKYVDDLTLKVPSDRIDYTLNIFNSLSS